MVIIIQKYSNEEKNLFLKKKEALEDIKGKYQKILKCELCGVFLNLSYTISVYGVAYNISCDGHFHHDLVGDIHAYCQGCHYSLHRWGGL